MSNYAYIDGQNLNHSTALSSHPWKIDLRKFRQYLRRKYQVQVAYYFIGAYLPENAKLYKSLKHYGYQVIFREHNNSATSQKKGNVDTDIVFAIMHDLIENKKLHKVVLVSGDGDYWRMVTYLIQKHRFAKLLAPDRHFTSSLYHHHTPDSFISYLDSPNLKRKLQLPRNGTTNAATSPPSSLSPESAPHTPSPAPPPAAQTSPKVPPRAPGTPV